MADHENGAVHRRLSAHSVETFLVSDWPREEFISFSIGRHPGKAYASRSSEATERRADSHWLTDQASFFFYIRDWEKT